MEHSDEIIEKLTKIEIFSDFSEKTDENIRILKEICHLLEVQDFNKGAAIITEGDMGDALFILYEGTVQVRRNTPSQEQFAVANLNASYNVFFGEVALIDKDTRSASVIAMEDCRTLRLDGDKFKNLCDKEPNLGYHAIYRIAKRLASSLRRSNKDMLILYEALLDEVNGF